jgi:hypothetical protein
MLRWLTEPALAAATSSSGAELLVAASVIEVFDDDVDDAGEVDVDVLDELERVEVDVVELDELVAWPLPEEPLHPNAANRRVAPT